MRSTETNVVNNSQQLGNEYISSAFASPTKIVNTDLTPVGDDSGPIEASREDVEMENEEDEDEEPLKAEVPRARTNQKNPTSRRNKNLKCEAKVGRLV